MRKLTTFVGLLALVVAACGASASPSPVPTETPAPTGAATAAPTAAPTASATVTFDGATCAYSGPTVVPAGTKLTIEFQNTPAAIQASTNQGATSIGSDLVILPVKPGTTEATLEATMPAPEGTKGDWDVPDWAIASGQSVIYGPQGTRAVEAEGAGYALLCNVYWNYFETDSMPFAFWPGQLVQVLPS